MIATHGGRFAIGASADVVRPVLAYASTVLHDDLAEVPNAVAVFVRQPEKAAFAVLGVRAIGVERGPVEPDSLAVLDLVADDLFGLEESVGIHLQQPCRIAALLRDDRKDLGVERHLDQGSDLVRVSSGVDYEARGT